MKYLGSFGCRSKPTFCGRCTTLFRTYFSGDWDVHWGTIWILTHGHFSRKDVAEGHSTSPVRRPVTEPEPEEDHLHESVGHQIQ